MRLSVTTGLILAVGLALILFNVVNVANSGGETTARGEPEGRKVFAHYFPPYPISFENAPASRDYYSLNYLTPGGEGGKFADVGGLLRDRPIGRPPLRVANFLLADLRTEVRQAKAAGIDGFTLNIMTLYGANWVAGINLMKAAEEVGDFTVVPNLDVSAEVADEAPEAIATKLAELYAYPSSEKMNDAYMLSSFDAEARSPSWWAQLKASLANRGYRTNFIAVFLNPSPTNFTAFASIVYGYSWWGPRTTTSLRAAGNLAKQAHELGRRWMEPVVVQDARPKAGIYAEAGNTELLRSTWTKAISERADYVQLVTWNDYSESTAFAPSVAHGRTFLGISRFYLDWFKEQRKPDIASDHLFITHRAQPYAARTSSGIMVMKPTLDGTTVEPRDTVEALTYLTAPARVSITVGGVTRTHAAPAGVSAFTVPLREGSVSARVVRDSRTIDTATSPRSVTGTPYQQDMQYWASGE